MVERYGNQVIVFLIISPLRGMVIPMSLSERNDGAADDECTGREEHPVLQA